MSGGSSVPRIQVFRPTMDEFKNFSKYIESIESLGAHKAGLAKIIPPEGWNPRKRGYDDIELMIPAPISQVVTGRQGLYQQINIQQKAMSVKEFKKLAESSKYQTPQHFDYEDLERKYWKNITYNSPIYGADVSGSLYEDGIKEFNIQHLNTILDMVKEDYEIQIEGVNTAYLYFGMWKTTFAWHTEDMDLYSINYLHFGAPKSWYVVPPEHGRRLERLASGFFHGSYQSCPAFLRHKMTIISPQILKQYSIPYSKITQEPGEFMITFPFGYHSGFNHGFNCAESTNFALPRWVEYGKRTTSCTCRNDCVKICMDMFVRKFQPDRYELWKAGKDFGVHPEDPNRHYAAPAPKKLELALHAQREERKKAKLTQKIKRHPISKLEKLEQKQEKVKQRVSTENSDSEETEVYDVDEVIANKNRSQKKSRKKSCDSAKESTSFDTEKSFNNDNNDATTDECNDKISKKLYETINKKTNEDVVDNNFKDGDTSAEKSNIACKEFSIKADVIETPPELKPFWDLQAGKLIKRSVDSQSTVAMKTTVNECEKPISIFDQYPMLKHAVSSGSMSVLIVKPEKQQVTTTATVNFTVNNAIKSEKKTNLFLTSDFSHATISHNWKCEQTDDLKIRLVQPKKVLETKINVTQPQASSCIVKPEIFNISKNLPSNISKIVGTVEKSPSNYNIDYTKDATNISNTSNEEIKQADSTMGNWAQALTNLWQHQPYNFEAECKFNEELSKRDPHCSICIIFSPMQANTEVSTEPVEMPGYSTVKMPAFCYGNRLKGDCILDTNPLLLRDGRAPLLVCSVCKVCVHATCYGITMLHFHPWVCTRCASYDSNVECCLCVLRGGALKPTNDGRWVHVICAILIPEAYFENTLSKEPVNVSGLTTSRKRLRCKYCIKPTTSPDTSLKDTKGACVQCKSGKCKWPFHVTCGYMAGVVYEADDWPEPLYMICTKHHNVGARRKPVKRQLSAIEVGEPVLCKHHRNKRYYWATLKDKYKQDYYSILFEDNSHSTNTLPEDIVSRNVAIEGPPEMNEKIQVKWTDDKIYNGIFKGSQSCEIFVVEFEDGSVMHQERQQIYATNEELPKEVLSKMSHSSERKNCGTSHSTTDGKRLRITNTKYTTD